MDEAMETAIFSRYSVLSIMNLLFYQAELAALQKEFLKDEEINSEASTTPTGAWLLHRAVHWDAIANAEGEAKGQKVKWLQIRRVLKEYGKRQMVLVLSLCLS
jgi:hypothetical protein